MKVLLVDDSVTMRTIQKRCLAALGIEDVIDAEYGQKALEQFAAHTFDIILSDWNMPVMDGLTFLKEIRQKNKDIPFIMITTEAERARVVTAIQAGVSDYLVKPFTPDGLKEKLEKWVTVNVERGKVTRDLPLPRALQLGRLVVSDRYGLVLYATHFEPWGAWRVEFVDGQGGAETREFPQPPGKQSPPAESK